MTTMVAVVATGGRPANHCTWDTAQNGKALFSRTSICAQVRQHMFEPFYTAPRRHTKKGLGLAAVDGVLKANNGHIHVQSEEGHGTAVTLYLRFAGTGL
ncbi:MAG: hypothetical protein VR64_16780 [Desulfatitalea sp. BRH_c12]|nr:MAG: hypothetical protein VR64_16780 [Desulfatitalea sp. BRH_c12]